MKTKIINIAGIDLTVNYYKYEGISSITANKDKTNLKELLSDHILKRIENYINYKPCH